MRSLGGRADPLAASARPFFVGFREQSGREFINRVDEILIFNLLGKSEIEKIIDLQVANLSKGYNRCYKRLPRRFPGSILTSLTAPS